MWKKKTKNQLSHFTDNELLTELLKRSNVPLYPASEEDELKIAYFKAFWQRLSSTEIFDALSNHYIKISNAEDEEVDTLQFLQKDSILESYK